MRLSGAFISYIKYFSNAWMFYNNIYYFGKMESIFFKERKRISESMETKINLELTLIKRQPVPGRGKRHVEKGEPRPSCLVSFK